MSYLTEELVAMGHDVTLFASGDSKTSARLVPCCEKALRLDSQCRDSLAWHLMEMETVARSAHKFDVIHYHLDYLHFPVSTRLQAPHVTTLHGRLDLPELPLIYQMFPGMPLISISHAQRKPLPNLNWRANVYHGLPEWPGDATRDVNGSKRTHLTFLGRISPEKRVDRAIQIAVQSRQPLVIAAKVDRVDQDYFDREIAPLLSHPCVRFIGEVDEEQKHELLHTTRALLFPIDWPEPFGLVMIEAMGCGVPVIAFEAGSVTEIIDEGVTGFIVNSVEEAVKAVGAIDRLDRERCRAVFRKRFAASKMAAEYVGVYQQLIGASPSDPRVRLSVA